MTSLVSTCSYRPSCICVGLVCPTDITLFCFLASFTLPRKGYFSPKSFFQILGPASWILSKINFLASVVRILIILTKITLIYIDAFQDTQGHFA